MEVTGVVHVIGDVMNFPSGFFKREMVLKVIDGKFEQFVPFQFIKDKSSLLDNVSVGQQVTVKFDLRGREYNGRYYPEITGWAINADGAQPPQQQATVQAAPMPQQAAPIGDDNDLPF